jgi:hypothetical protein
LPQREFVRSATRPIIGSLTASTTFVTMNITPTSAGSMPNTSV